MAKCSFLKKLPPPTFPITFTQTKKRENKNISYLNQILNCILSYRFHNFNISFDFILFYFCFLCINMDCSFFIVKLTIIYAIKCNYPRDSSFLWKSPGVVTFITTILYSINYIFTSTLFPLYLVQ